MEGTITAIVQNKGYGFLRSGGREIFFHVSALPSNSPFDAQLIELPVKFDVVETSKGPRAENVRPLRELPC